MKALCLLLAGVVAWVALALPAPAGQLSVYQGGWITQTGLNVRPTSSTASPWKASWRWNGSAWVQWYTAFTPVTHTHTGIGSGTDTVPTGASQVVIDCRGRGGPGGSGISTNKAAAGGGGGGRIQRTIVLVAGDWGYGIPWSITGGVGSASTPSVALTNFSGTMIATNGGTGGTSTLTAIGGAGGTGTNGTTNTSGTAGGNSSGTTGGGNGGSGADGSGGGSGGDNLGGPASAGTDPSGGGGGQPYQTPSGPNGTPGLSSSGQCSFAYT